MSLENFGYLMYALVIVFLVWLNRHPAEYRQQLREKKLQEKAKKQNG